MFSDLHFSSKPLLLRRVLCAFKGGEGGEGGEGGGGGEQRGVRESQHIDQSIEVELLFNQHWEGAL